MKRKLALLAMASVLALSTVACGSGDSGDSAKKDDAKTESGSEASSDVANKDKPLVWFNRQPSNSSTGELDTAALNFNKDTYYVGFDANQGAELQGTMVKEYIEKNIDKIDRNGDGVIGYVLAMTQLPVQEVCVKRLEQQWKKMAKQIVLRLEQIQMAAQQRYRMEKLK